MTISKSIKVERSPQVSFRVFCEQISDWWPGGFGGKDARVCLECRLGGRLFERRADGSEYEIGQITAYEPPARLAFTWRAPSWQSDTEVEIRFLAEDHGTRVHLEHRGWEREAAILESRKNYDGGWDLVLGHYRDHVGS